MQFKYIFIVKTFLFLAIQFSQAVLIQLSISTDFVYTQLNVKTVYIYQPLLSGRIWHRVNF